MTVVLDSSAIVSFFSEADSNHGPAVALLAALRRARATLVLPGEVLTETINVVGKRFGHEPAYELALLLLASDFVVEETEPRLRLQAIERFHQQPESVSLIDCCVMEIAVKYDTPYVFGFDACFRKNGFTLPHRT